MRDCQNLERTRKTTPLKLMILVPVFVDLDPRHDPRPSLPASGGFLVGRSRCAGARHQARELAAKGVIDKLEKSRLDKEAHKRH